MSRYEASAQTPEGIVASKGLGGEKNVGATFFLPLWLNSSLEELHRGAFMSISLPLACVNKISGKSVKKNPCKYEVKCCKRLEMQVVISRELNAIHFYILNQH
jgi:hypothetical protein